MLDIVKLALRITTDAFDTELNSLIASALLDLGIAGIDTEDADALIQTAVTTYCKLHFGEPSDAERLQSAYDMQKAQLQTATGYTDWGDD